MNITDATHPDDMLEIAHEAIQATGLAIAASDHDTALTQLGTASDAIAYLQTWDLPPSPGAWTIWQQRVVMTLLRTLAQCSDAEMVQQVRMSVSAE
jgi:type II secretory pathway component PulM